MAFNPRCVMASGARLDPRDPDPAEVRIHDIAQGLAYQNRYNGQAGVWSVAQHSLLALELADEYAPPPLARLAVLLHDCGEAAVGDVIAPVRAVLAVGDRHPFDELEARMRRAMLTGLGLPVAEMLDEPEMVEFVDAVDAQTYLVEAAAILPPRMAQAMNAGHDIPDRWRLRAKWWKEQSADYAYETFQVQYTRLRKVWASERTTG